VGAHAASLQALAVGPRHRSSTARAKVVGDVEALESDFGPSAWAAQVSQCRNVAQKRGSSVQALASELAELAAALVDHLRRTH
jgi:hypothetical protein